MPQLVFHPVAKTASPKCAPHVRGLYEILWEITEEEAEDLTPEQYQKLMEHPLNKRFICVN
jgi:hypothetical protein